MPIEDADLDAASAAGVVTASQAEALRDFVADRQRRRLLALSHEERFRFMRGFNDFFFAVGIALFGGGLSFFALATPAGSLVAAAIMWGLAELLVARMRLVLPGILLACLFVFFVMAASPVDLWVGPFSKVGAGSWFWSERSLTGSPLTAAFYSASAMALYALAGGLAAGLFYARFRLPFTLLLLAGALVIATLNGIQYGWPAKAAAANSMILLICGISIFAAAMRFDIADRDRVTLRADCAFWLHLLAAPLIVHSLIALVTPDITLMSTAVAAMIIVIFATLTFIAIVIDRRALLVSALIYIGTVIAYGIRSTVGAGREEQPFVFFVTWLVLGSVVLVIGVGWQPLRRLLLAGLPAPLRYRLPQEADRNVTVEALKA
jgi:hypothetical protein